MTPLQSFSVSYDEARRKFLQAAQDAGLAVQSHVHPLPGRYGVVLAMDVVREGPADARQLLIVSSACHGVEGYCGSGFQVDWLASIGALDAPSMREPATEQRVAVARNSAAWVEGPKPSRSARESL